MDPFMPHGGACESHVEGGSVGALSVWCLAACEWTPDWQEERLNQTVQTLAAAPLPRGTHGFTLILAVH